MKFTVKPLVFDKYGNAQGVGCSYMMYEVLNGWNAVIYPVDSAHYQLATKVSEKEAIEIINNDHVNRVLNLIEVV